MPEQSLIQKIIEAFAHPGTWVASIVTIAGTISTLYTLAQRTKTKGKEQEAKGASHETEKSKEKSAQAKYEDEIDLRKLVKQLQAEIITMQSEHRKEIKEYYAEIDKVRKDFQQQIDLLHKEIQLLERNKSQIEQNSVALQDALDKELAKNDTLSTELERREFEIKELQKAMQQFRDGHAFMWIPSEKHPKTIPHLVINESERTAKITGMAQTQTPREVFQFHTEQIVNLIRRGGAIISIQLSFVGTTSRPYLLEMFDAFQKEHDADRKLDVVWLYEKDQDMQESAAEWLSDYTFPNSIEEIL
jgi:type III secretory pathway component EscV